MSRDPISNPKFGDKWSDGSVVDGVITSTKGPFVFYVLKGQRYIETPTTWRKHAERLTCIRTAEQLLEQAEATGAETINIYV